MIRLFEAARSVSALRASLYWMLSASHSTRVVLSVPLIALLMCLSSATSQAGPINNYGNFMGNTVEYQMVREASNSGDSLPLFGAPTVSGDSLDFDPVGFGASTIGGGVDITDGNLAFMVKAKPGNAILNLKISEFGDTTLAGFGSDTTFSSVTMKGILNIFEVGFVGINTVAIPISITNFGPSGGTFGLASDFAGGPGGTLAWSGSTLIDLTTANPAVAAAYTAQSLNFALPVTKISVNFDNTLVAISQTGTSALIAKKDASGVIVTTNVPEPTSCALAMFGVLVGVLVSRRSR